MRTVHCRGWGSGKVAVQIKYNAGGADAEGLRGSRVDVL